MSLTKAISQQKKQLRERIKRECQSMPQQYYELVSGHILDKIEGLTEFTRARTVAIFWPLPTEVNTLPLIHTWCTEKNLLLPVMQCGKLIFRYYTPETTMKRHDFGVWEPQDGDTVNPETIDLMIIPGLAFDRTGGRLGYGKGFYDKFLAAIPAERHPVKVGICFDFQWIDQVPATDLDVKMDGVIWGSETEANLCTPSESRIGPGSGSIPCNKKNAIFAKIFHVI